MKSHEEISLELFKLLPSDQVDRVFNSNNMVDICAEFLGFVSIYNHLSQIIPKHFTVVDLGCAYNAQSFYFTEHKQYIAVDNFPQTERFCADNCVFFDLSIEDYIKNHTATLDMDETFAICSYVPPWGADNMKLTRDNFKNVFTYYPHGTI